MKKLPSLHNLLVGGFLFSIAFSCATFKSEHYWWSTEPSPYPQDFPVTSWAAYYGPLDEIAVQRLKLFDLVVLHPNNSMELSHTVLRRRIQTVQSGRDSIPGTSDDTLVLAYISVGEDDRPHKYFFRGPEGFIPDWEKIQSDSLF